MNDALISSDLCQVCQRAVSRDRVCHIYRNGSPVTLCGPACVQDYVLGSRSTDAGEKHSILQDALTRYSWSAGG